MIGKTDRSRGFVAHIGWSIVCLSLLIGLSVGGCNKNDEKCKALSVANGDFAACRWLVSEADNLCKSKGYEMFWGKIISTDSCDQSENVYISGLTCCP